MHASDAGVFGLDQIAEGGVGGLAKGLRVSPLRQEMKPFDCGRDDSISLDASASLLLGRPREILI